MGKKSIRQILADRRAEREAERRMAEVEQERQERASEQTRRRTIADATSEENHHGLRNWQDRARKEAAAADARSREENQRSGRQTERSPHLAHGPAGGIVDSRAGSERRRREEQDEAPDPSEGLGFLYKPLAPPLPEQLGKRQRVDPY